MSSSVNNSNEAQNKLKECSERGNVLLELLNNSPHRSGLFNPNDVLNEEDGLLNSGYPEFRTPPGSPNGFTVQTRPSNAKVGHGQGNDKDIAHPTVQLDKDPSMLPDERTVSSRNFIHTETSSNAKKCPRFDLDLNSSHSHDGPKDEYEVLVEIQNGNNRNYPIKSILKNGGLTSAFTNYSTDPENIPSNASSQLVTTTPNDTEIDLSSKMADQHDGRCGVYVSIPIATHQKRSKKHIAQLVAMSGCGFILVSLILAWILSPTFL